MSSKLTDLKSKYINIYALYGGVMKCSSCTFSFTDSILDGNQAQSGGVFMVENDAKG